MIYLAALLIAMFITIGLIPIFKRLAVRFNVVDLPDDRKVHTVPTPRIGGLAMALGALIPVVLWIRLDDVAGSMLVGAWILVLFGLIDDRQNLNYRIKFASQFLAACLVVLWGGLKIKSLGAILPSEFLLPDWIAIPLTLVVIVGVTNAINLADGLDGLAGGISLLSFICIGYLAYCSGQMLLTLIAVSVVGGLIGFLRFNTHPAEVFMGDAGSQYLGFLAITLSLGITQHNNPVSPMLPLLLLGFPVLDTLTVMIQRIHEGRSPFYPDKNHFHHKLLRIGFVHSEAVLLIYIIQSFLVGAALYLRYYSDWLLLILYLTISVLIVGGIYLADRTGWELKRIDVLERFIRGRLKELKEKNILIKITFKTVEILFPLMLLTTFLLPGSMPPLFSGFALLMVILIVPIAITGKVIPLRTLMRVSIYLTIPVVVYLGQAETISWISGNFLRIYNLFFAILVVFMILTLKFSRREGFKSTPMDFLILFIAVVVPNIPDEQFRSYGMGVVAVKIIVFFFCFEVLLGEIRNKLNRIAWVIIAGLSIVILKGLL